MGDTFLSGNDIASGELFENIAGNGMAVQGMDFDQDGKLLPPLRLHESYTCSRASPSTTLTSIFFLLRKMVTLTVSPAR
jgi:hypothetical protein